jgi:hypothetical protein
MGKTRQLNQQGKEAIREIFERTGDVSCPDDGGKNGAR